MGCYRFKLFFNDCKVPVNGSKSNTTSVIFYFRSCIIRVNVLINYWLITLVVLFEPLANRMLQM